MAATTSIDHVALPPPSSKKKTVKQVTFVDHGDSGVQHRQQCTPQDSCHGKRKTATLKDEDLLTSSLSRTMDSKNEVKVGSFNHFRTQKCTLPPLPPSSKTIRHSTPVNTPFPMAPKPILHHPEVQSPLATSPHTTAQVWDIMALKRAFPNSFDTIGNMPETYTIRTDPAFPLVQHARHKVPIEYREQIEKPLDKMVLKGVIAPVSKPTA